jgi:hypothetical protein
VEAKHSTETKHNICSDEVEAVANTILVLLVSSEKPQKLTARNLNREDESTLQIEHSSAASHFSSDVSFQPWDHYPLGSTTILCSGFYVIQLLR